ncbi:MAG: ACT domain-containing protein [Vallitaleaceae bacterium]|jgi:ACT domain-containing protein|nr:ACT domain-containing protein [Vallitaleaceae bacterium]
MKKGIITVLGKDRVGIMAKVCTYLAEKEINILEINQTIVSDYFNMMMVVDLSNSKSDFATSVDDLDAIGQEIGVVIKLQLEDIFNKMHRI